MPISSLIIRTNPNEINSVAKKIESYKNVSSSEVHRDNLVVVTDTKDREEDKALWEAFEAIPGVLQCDLIYHNFEDVEGSKDA